MEKAPSQEDKNKAQQELQAREKLRDTMDRASQLEAEYLSALEAESDEEKKKTIVRKYRALLEQALHAVSIAINELNQALGVEVEIIEPTE